MTCALITVAPKLEKLIPLLSSDKEGEVVATARAIVRTLAQAGLDLHDLAKVLGLAAPSPAPVGWRHILHPSRPGWLAEMRASPLLSPWEQNFCNSILAQVRFRPWSAEADRGTSKIVGEVR